MISDKFKEWSFTQLVVRWRYLNTECWNYDAPSDENFNQMLREAKEISDELELRGYRYSLELNQWYDAIPY